MEKNKPLHPDLCRKHHLLQAGLFIHTWTIRTLKCFLEKDIPLHPSIHPSFSTKSESKQAQENVKFSRVKYFTATLLSGRNQHFIGREYFCALDIPRNNSRGWFSSDICKFYWSPMMAATWKWTSHGFFSFSLFFYDKDVCQVLQPTQ